MALTRCTTQTDARGQEGSGCHIHSAVFHPRLVGGGAFVRVCAERL